MKTTSDSVVNTAAIFYIAKRVVSLLYPNEQDNKKIDTQIANEIIAQGKGDSND